MTLKSGFTKNAEDLTAKELLEIPESEPELIFPSNDNGRKKLFSTLVKKWHPDRNSDPQAALVFNLVTKLNDLAKEKLENGTWHVPGLLTITQKSGRKTNIKYLKKHNFELGEFYITNKKVVYVVRPEFADLFRNAVGAIKSLHFPNDDMRKKFDTYMPKIDRIIEAQNGDNILVLERDPNTILLRDYLEHAEKIDPKHVAWMMSRLHNMTSYLQWAGITHNGMSLDTCFILPKDHSFKRTKSNPIAPKDHSLAVLGGWWYAAQEGRSLKGLPSQAVNYAPRAVLEEGRADHRIDHSMIRVMGRELLGDITGVRLEREKGVPKAMADWLILPGSGDAIEDFQRWRREVLPASFGKIKFVDLDIKPTEIYTRKFP